MVLFSTLGLLGAAAGVAGPAASERRLVFACRQDNDLFRTIAERTKAVQRYDDPKTAFANAPEGSCVFVLADDYPTTRTSIDQEMFDTAAARKLRVFVEYPSRVPGLQLEPATRQIEWERIVVSSALFGEALPRLRILTVHQATFIPCDVKSTLLVAARVAGFDTAIFGLPKTVFPILFELPKQNMIVATTRLSGFIHGRYAPAADWEHVWEYVLTRMGVDPKLAQLHWPREVAPAYGEKEAMPAEHELQANKAFAEWIRASRLLVGPSSNDSIRKLLSEGVEFRKMPAASDPEATGALGILEGYSSQINADGTQPQRLPLRADCHAESAMALGFDNDAQSSSIAANLLDFVYFSSNMCTGPRADVKHPAFGLIAWGDVSAAWLKATYGDDEARTILATLAAAASLRSDKWDLHVMRALLANLRTTGRAGFRGDRIDMPELEQHGWKYFHDREIVNCAPHFESYLWACYLWAYRHTRHAPFLDTAKKGISRTMQGYPKEWRWNDTIERSRMILCLAWLVQVENSPQHAKWLDQVTSDLIRLQQPSGAIQETFNALSPAFKVPNSNEAYGTDETPLIQNNGDPASDQLYSTGFALLGLHEAYAATKDPALKQAEDRLAEYLCRIQVRSKKHPYFNGSWFRAFDYRRWDYWASSADVGWGPWCIEAGWGQAWTAATLALRSRNTSLWQLTADSNIKDQLQRALKEMGE